MSGRKQRMSFQDAMDMTPDDLPDGAFFAMAHELAGLEYGDGFAELAGDDHRPGPAAFNCTKKLRAKIEAHGTLHQHDTYHWTVRKDGRVIADWWPHKRQWRIAGKTHHGQPAEFVKALAARQP
jgi:hypothetical protein